MKVAHLKASGRGGSAVEIQLLPALMSMGRIAGWCEGKYENTSERETMDISISGIILLKWADVKHENSYNIAILRLIIRLPATVLGWL